MWLKTKTYSNIKLQKYWNPKLILDTIINKNKQLIWVIKLVCKCLLLFIVYSCEYISKLQSHIMLQLYRKNIIFSRISRQYTIYSFEKQIEINHIFLELKCNFCFNVWFYILHVSTLYSNVDYEYCFSNYLYLLNIFWKKMSICSLSDTSVNSYFGWF